MTSGLHRQHNTPDSERDLQFDLNSGTPRESCSLERNYEIALSTGSLHACTLVLSSSSGSESTKELAADRVREEQSYISDPLHAMADGSQSLPREANGEY